MTPYQRLQWFFAGMIIFMFGVAVGAITAALIEALKVMGGP
jgi:hypothetical protein